MNNNLNLKIGDKVIRNYGNSLPTSIGIVVNITEKRGDYVVDFGNYKETYDKRGWQKGGDIWYRSTIKLLTPEIEEDIRRKNIMYKCKEKFKNTEITYEQAVKILEILESGKKQL